MEHFTCGEYNLLIAEYTSLYFYSKDNKKKKTTNNCNITIIDTVEICLKY